MKGAGKLGEARAERNDAYLRSLGGQMLTFKQIPLLENRVAK